MELFASFHHVHLANGKPEVSKGVRSGEGVKRVTQSILQNLTSINQFIQYPDEQKTVIPFYGNLRWNLSDLPKARTIRIVNRKEWEPGPLIPNLTYIVTAKRRRSLTQEMVLKRS